MNAKNRLLNELCKNGNLENHREPLASLLDLIIESGVKISTRYGTPASNYETFVDTDKRIRISLVNVVDPLDIVWKIMHEFGHYLSGKRKPEDHTMDREELAWRVMPIISFCNFLILFPLKSSMRLVSKAVFILTTSISG